MARAGVRRLGRTAGEGVKYAIDLARTVVSVLATIVALAFLFFMPNGDL